MAIAPTICYFGASPTTIIMQSSSNFDGTAQLGVPVISSAIYTFAPQAGGGLYNFHSLVGTQEAVTIKSISYFGGGTLTVKRILSTAAGTPSITVGTVSSAGDLVFNEGDLILPFGENLIFTSSGGSSPVIAVTAKLARSSGLR